MEHQRAYYSVLQFSPFPERFEFVNIGVLLYVPAARFIGIKLSKSNRRIEKLFGPQQDGYIDFVKESFEQRLRLELAKGLDREQLSAFGLNRANNIRMSKLLPIVAENPEAAVQNLFNDLVGDEVVIKRQPRVAALLKRRFEKEGVAHYVQERPEPVQLQGQGVTISAPFGYQNGAFNLIAPIRLGGETGDALREAGKRALEGQMLAEHNRKSDVQRRLVVVGEFSKQPSSFVNTVSDLMDRHSVRFFDLREIDPLIADIKHNALYHAAEG